MYDTVVNIVCRRFGVTGRINKIKLLKRIGFFEKVVNAAVRPNEYAISIKIEITVGVFSVFKAVNLEVHCGIAFPGYLKRESIILPFENLH